MSDVNFRKLSRQMSGRSGWSGSLILFVVLLLVASLVVWSNLRSLTTSRAVTVASCPRRKISRQAEREA